MLRKKAVEEVISLFKNENLIIRNVSGEPDCITIWLEEYKAYFLIQNYSLPPYNRKTEFEFRLVYSAELLMEWYLDEVVSRIAVDYCMIDVCGKFSLELVQDALEATRLHLDYYVSKLPQYKAVAEAVYRHIEAQYFKRCDF